MIISPLKVIFTFRVNILPTKLIFYLQSKYFTYKVNIEVRNRLIFTNLYDERKRLLKFILL